jgi:hypothetical protein
MRLGVSCDSAVGLDAQAVSQSSRCPREHLRTSEDRSTAVPTSVCAGRAGPSGAKLGVLTKSSRPNTGGVHDATALGRSCRDAVLPSRAWPGKLAKPGSARDDCHRLMSRAYLELVAEHGLLREDLDLQAIAYAFLVTFEGFLARRQRRPPQRRRPPAAPRPGWTSGQICWRGPSSEPSRAGARSLAPRSSPSPLPSSTCWPTSPSPTAPTSASPKPDTGLAGGGERCPAVRHGVAGRTPSTEDRHGGMQPTSTERPTNPSYRHGDEIIADARRPGWRNQLDAELLFTSVVYLEVAGRPWSASTGWTKSAYTLYPERGAKLVATERG